MSHVTYSRITARRDGLMAKGRDDISLNSHAISLCVCGGLQVGSLDAASVANMWEAFVHVRYSSDATEKEVQRLLARISTDRIGLRHFTAPQLSKMAYVLTPSEPVERGVLGAIRDECLRQTLQRCRAGDIGRLLSSFCYADSKPDADMLEACVERASRRGFLARDSTPKDVATLLWGFKQVKSRTAWHQHRISEAAMGPLRRSNKRDTVGVQAQHPPSDAITKKVVELGSQPSFLSGLDVSMPIRVQSVYALVGISPMR